MRKTNFTNVDLNLLKLFDALLRERSVTRAGVELGLSQPAASRALGRLRHLFADRLVVRTRNGLELTPRAIALAEPVARLLENARAIVAPAEFDPATARAQVTVATIDHMSLMIMPSLISRLGRLAPGLDLEIPPPLGNNVDIVAQGNADLALGVYDDHDLPSGFFRRALYDENLACVVRHDHPVITEGLTLERFAALLHLQVIITGRGESSIDIALQRYGLKRRVAVRLPHFLAAPMLVAESDMILSLPRRLAHRISTSTPIAVLELPFDLDGFTLSMIWHERRQDDPAHLWLRRQVVEAVQQSIRD